MGLFDKKKTITLECPNCKEQWEIDKKTWNFTSYGDRARTPAFLCPKCRCQGSKVK